MRFAPPLLTAALALALPLGACGFRPLYAPTPTGGPAIGSVIVDEAPGKAGHALKMELDRLFDVERGAGAAQRLSLTVNESVAGLGFRVDESASRSDLTLNASYVLYDPAGNVLLRGTASSVASYNIPSSAYGEYAAQQDARERAAELLAERIRVELALQLSDPKVRAGAAAPAPAAPTLATPGPS